MTPEAPARRSIRFGLASLLATATVAHLAVPRAFESMIPRWLPGSRRSWNLAATTAEGACAVLLVPRRTSRLGGALTAVTLVVVFVANVQAVADGGMRGLPGPLATRRAALLRLPLQIPLVWGAWRVSRPE